MFIASVIPSSHLILCRPLLLPSIFPSIRVFSNKSALHMRWPKYWSFSFSIIPSKESPGLISFTQTHVHRVSDAIQPSILCCPLLLLPSILPSVRIFSNESALRIGWPKYWSFSFSISPSNEHPGPISFRMDWLDLLAVQGTLKSLLQHHSSKASILRRLAF